MNTIRCLASTVLAILTAATISSCSADDAAQPDADSGGPTAPSVSTLEKDGYECVELATPEGPDDSAYSCAQLSDGAISAVTFVVHDGLVTRWSGKVAQATTAGITKEAVTGALDPLIAMLAGPDSAKIRGGLTSELASASGFSSPRTQGKAFQFWMEVESAEKPAYARAEITALPPKPGDVLAGGGTTSKETTLNTKKLKENLSDAGFTCSGTDGPVIATVDCSGPATIKSGAFKGQLSNLAITVGLDAQSDAATTLSPVSKALERALGGPGAAVTDVITDKLQPGAFTLEKVGDLLVVIDALAADRVQIDVFL